ncbi:unnamed protein product [[Actinomadura] parvosata subsp. kistnae]|uniref:Uncharacterized protein n=1 Tax=[Actinomadura] parvosata subsp. kistnae TaxID=1909395 RepID=A0A1U9ZVZ8_9ACTN|nr:hypothetical protein [Nonomuraea sp. ATCC 55076]AQZ62136.1 hypothetical protein BKM31_12230 [Nonomuraea sp. ATCC 55076]SPL95881.1 unnamed protein product [Actinomadura parvosata subsp. kistnae]
MASVVFGTFAVIALIVAVVLFLVLRRKPHTRVGAYVSAPIVLLAAGMLGMGALAFGSLEAAGLRTFTPEERAAAVPCQAAVLGAEQTSNKLNGRYFWLLRLRVTPRAGSAYEIERTARLTSPTGERLRAGNVVLPCLVDPGDQSRIDIPALGK